MRERGIHSHIWYVFSLIFLPSHLYHSIGHKQERPDLHTTLQTWPWESKCEDDHNYASHPGHDSKGEQGCEEQSKLAFGTAASPSLELIYTQGEVVRSHHHPHPVHTPLQACLHHDKDGRIPSLCSSHTSLGHNARGLPPLLIPHMLTNHGHATGCRPKNLRDTKKNLPKFSLMARFVEQYHRCLGSREAAPSPIAVISFNV